MRAIVHKAGGRAQAGELLGLDQKTVRAHELASGLALVVYRGSNTEKIDADGQQGRATNCADVTHGRYTPRENMTTATLPGGVRR